MRRQQQYQCLCCLRCLLCMFVSALGQQAIAVDTSFYAVRSSQARNGGQAKGRHIVQQLLFWRA
jgi:hypothetical protein